MSGEELREYGRRTDRVYGDRLAVVETEGTGDPRKLLRVQVRVHGLFDKAPLEDLPWAEIKLPLGAGENEGKAIIAAIKKGHTVWVDFPYGGDTRRPRITGSVHFAPSGVLNLPHESFAGVDAYQHKRAGEEPEQPEHVYGEDAISTLHGTTVERNKDGSYCLYQRGTGTEITVTKDGHIILHCEGDIYRSATGDSKAVINGLEKIEIMGKQTTLAMEGIEHDGGTGAPEGNVTRVCVCPLIMSGHIMSSETVRSSL